MQANQTRSAAAKTAHGFPAVLSGLYDCLGILSEDARTIVYKAKHKEVDRLVAVKVFHSVDVNRMPSGFDLALRNTGSLNHPNIIRVYSFGISSTGHPYVVSQHFEGKTLAELIVGDGRMNVHRFCQIFLPILHAMAYTHQKGLVHGDLTSKNVIITGNASAGVPKLTNFSIAQWHEHVLGGANTTSEKRLLYGTPAYMSPERCEGEKCTPSSDIYALGCMMFEALTGKLPFTGTTGDIIQKQLSENAPTLDPSIPRPVHALVMQALAKEPHIRHQSTGDMYDALRAVADDIGASLGMGGEEPEEQPEENAANSKIGLAVIATFLGIIIGYVIWSTYTAHKSTQMQSITVTKTAPVPGPVVRIAAAPDLPVTVNPNDSVNRLLEQAEEALNARRFGNADTFRQAVLNAPKATVDNKARAYFVGARIAGARGDLKKAVADSVYADNLAHSANLQATRALILVYLADLYCQRGEFASAVNALEQARGIEHDTRGDDTMQMALINLYQGEAELGLNRLLNAGEHLREALYVVEKSPGRDGPARTRIDWNLANVYWKQGDFISAKPYLIHYLANAKSDQPAAYIARAKQMLADYPELTGNQTTPKHP